MKRTFAMAKECSPSVVFVDRMEVLTENGDERQSALRQALLTQMQGWVGDVYVLGATNEPWSMHETIRRQFLKRIYVPIPNE